MTRQQLEAVWPTLVAGSCCGRLSYSVVRSSHLYALIIVTQGTHALFMKFLNCLLSADYVVFYCTSCRYANEVTRVGSL